MRADRRLSADSFRNVYTVRTDLFTSDAVANDYTGSINLRGTLRSTTSGKQIGHFSRRFIEVKGSWHAVHQELFVTDDSYKRQGIARSMFSRAVRYYATSGVAKISMDAVQDGRYLWTAYGFGSEATSVSRIHQAMRRVYKMRQARICLLRCAFQPLGSLYMISNTGRPRRQACALTAARGHFDDGPNQSESSLLLGGSPLAVSLAPLGLTSAPLSCTHFPTDE
jgi:GNAT superfamily N-acetyltransferase